MAETEETVITLEDPGETEKSETDQLKQACRDGDVTKVKELLARDAPLRNLADCLEVAVENKQREVAKAFIEDERWEESLRKATKQDGDLQTPFRKLMETMPDVAALVLDKCIKPDPKDKKVSVIDYEFLEEFAATTALEPRGSMTWSRPYKHGDLKLLSKKSHVLEHLDGELLTHPVVTSLLRWKWLRYLAWLYFINLAFYLVFLSFLTAFALRVPNPQLPMCERELNQTASNSCDLSSGRQNFVITAAVITIVLSFVRLLFELCQLLRFGQMVKSLKKLLVKMVKCFSKPRVYSVELKSPVAEPSVEVETSDAEPSVELEISESKPIVNWGYFRRLSNYVEIPLYVLSFVFVGVLHRQCLCPSRGQWQAGIVAVFLAWIDLLLFLNKWPILGVYIGMLEKIILRFLTVAIIAILLLLAFGLAFYMAFFEPGLPDTPFMNPAVAFVEAISFAIGSPDISIFRLANDDTTVETIPYPGLSYIIWITFGIIVSVLFFNFLVGLAVDDVKELQKQANRHRMQLMIQLFIGVEDVLKIVIPYLKWIQCLAGCNYCVKQLNRRAIRQWSVDLKVKPFWYKIAILWGDEINQITTQLKKKNRIKSGTALS